MRRWSVLAILAIGCATNPPPPPYYQPQPGGPQPPQPPIGAPQPVDITRSGKLDDRLIDYQFDGGHLEFDLYRMGTRVVQTVRSRYAAPVMVAWQMNGTELPFLNGYPLRLVVPGYYGTYWIKHVSDIQVLDKPFDGFWVASALWTCDE